MKRSLDLLLATVLLIFLAPTLLLTALAIRLATAGSVLVGRRRIGMGGVEFEMLVFRTAGADGTLTPLGTLLCATRLDGLPRLFNVLRGDMSFVGPRPATRVALLSLGSEARLRYAANRPGLTGPWRVAGLDSGTDDSEDGPVLVDLTLGLPVLGEPSLRQDLRILLHTFGMVIGHGRQWWAR